MLLEACGLSGSRARSTSKPAIRERRETHTEHLALQITASREAAARECAVDRLRKQLSLHHLPAPRQQQRGVFEGKAQPPQNSNNTHLKGTLQQRQGFQMRYRLKPHNILWKYVFKTVFTLQKRKLRLSKDKKLWQSWDCSLSRPSFMPLLLGVWSQDQQHQPTVGA